MTNSVPPCMGARDERCVPLPGICACFDWKEMRYEEAAEQNWALWDEMDPDNDQDVIKPLNVALGTMEILQRTDDARLLQLVDEVMKQEISRDVSPPLRYAMMDAQRAWALSRFGRTW